MGAISEMIHANDAGTETVRLYAAADGQVPTHGTSAYKAASTNVDNNFPSYSVNEVATQDVVGGKEEIWPQVIEKAMAIEDGGYDAIAHGGWPVFAMEVLTGHGASSVAPADPTLAVLQNEITAGDLIVMDTPAGSNLPFNPVRGHAHMFEKVTTGGSDGPMVQLGNPWGFNQPTAIPLSQLAKGICQVDIGHFS